MRDYKSQFDVFVCGGSQHVEMLKPLLERLLPFGTVHLGSSFLSETDLRELRGLYDVLHTPTHSPDGYHNFELFAIRDINRLARAPHFVKLDADIHLAPDWIEYVEARIATHPGAVLFGPRRGNIDIDCELTGARVRRLLGHEVRVRGATKVIGGFYVGLTSFFKRHSRFMDLVHGLMRGGAACPAREGKAAGKFRGNEDTLRSLVVHALGAGDRLHVFDSHGRVLIHRAGTLNP